MTIINAVVVIVDQVQRGHEHLLLSLNQGHQDEIPKLLGANAGSLLLSSYFY